MRKELNQYLIIDWQDQTTKTRKTKPSQSDLGVHEIWTPLNLTIVVPDVDVPKIEAEVEVPQARVEEAIAESLGPDEQETWKDLADDMVLEAYEQQGDELNWIEHGTNVAFEVIREAPGYPEPDEVKHYVAKQIKSRVR